MNEFLNNCLFKRKIKKNSLYFLFFLVILTLFSFVFKVDVIGLLSLVTVSIITFYYSKKYNSLATILFVALSLRLITIFFGKDLVILPDSWGDATLFELKAWEWSQSSFVYSLSKFMNEDTSFFISLIISFFYSIFDRSVIMAQSISLLFGMGSILLASRIANKIWNESISIKFAWILAVYPTLILYSCLILREAYVWFFLLMSIYGALYWFEKRKLKFLLISLTGFIFSTLFHGGMIIGFFIFLIIIFTISINEIFKKIKYLKISRNSLIILILSITIVVYIFSINANFPKIGSIKNILDLNVVIEAINKRNISNAANPEWTIPQTNFELLYKSPIRVIYFIFSPFPWDISKITHILGLIDGLFHMILVIYLIKNFKSIMNDKRMRLIFIFLISYLILFGITTGNFGTGIRHRTKFIYLFILLVLPWLPKFSFNKKKN